MAPANTNDFALVSFEKDRERAFENLLLQPVLVTAWTTTSKPVFFQAVSSDHSGVQLKLVEGDPMSALAGDEIEILFSLDDGQFHWKTKLIQPWPDRWTVALGGELFRLQRRDNFRTSVPRGYRKAHFILKALKNLPLTPTEMMLVDVSAGGVRVKWPAAGLTKPLVGETLSGVLTTPGGRQIDIFGIVKSVQADLETPNVNVGIEFQNVSGRDEQVLLQLCLQIRREFVS